MLRKDQKTIFRQGIKMAISAIYMDLEVRARWRCVERRPSVMPVTLPLTSGSPPKFTLYTCLRFVSSPVTPTVHCLSLNDCNRPHGYPASTSAPLQTIPPAAARVMVLIRNLDRITSSLYRLFIALTIKCKAFAVVYRVRHGLNHHIVNM